MLEGQNVFIANRMMNTTYYVASVVMPSILLFDLYNRNFVENQILFIHVAVIAGFLAVIGLLLFVMFKFMCGSTEGSLLICLLFWLAFWLAETLLDIIKPYSTLLNSEGLFIIIVLGLAVLSTMFRRYKPPFWKVRPVFNVLSLVLLMFFVLNFAPGVNQEITMARGRAEVIELKIEESISPFYFKEDFYINPNLPAPDMYWIHVDGAMSIEMVEEFWGLCYESLREEFKGREFLIYEDATLNAGYTTAAFVALLMPTFYDSFWGEQLDKVEMYLRWPRADALRSALTGVGLDSFGAMRPNYEFLNALFLRGYELDIISPHERIPTSFEHLEEGEGFGRVEWWLYTFKLGDLPRLLTLTTPFSDLTSGLRVLVPSVTYLRNGDNPIAHFEWRIIMSAHMGEVHRMDPYATELDPTRYDLYPLAFEHALSRALDMVDNILKSNPDAVIVMQADHGFHLMETQEYMLEQGYSLEQIMALNHSVFSAVRIPQKYGGLDAAIAPLNITRELVNRFVGEGNYELLSD